MLTWRFDLRKISKTVSSLPQKRPAYILKNDRLFAGSRNIETGADHLLELKNLVQKRNEKDKQTQMRLPDLLIVLTGGKIAYTREDGVKVIPVGCLKD